METCQEGREERCPKCGAALPVIPGFTVWCDKCNWNVTLERTGHEPSAWERIYLKLGARLSEGLFMAVDRKPTKPGFSLTRLGAYLMAIAVYGAGLGLAVIGVVLVAHGWPNFVALIVGLALLGLAFCARPRFGRLKEQAVSWKEFPALYGLSERIAEALGTTRIRGIVIDGGFNAALVRSGWLRRSHLVLGLPLMTILDGQEITALIAHELAHGVNGDPARSFLVGGAANTLFEWYVVLKPGKILPPGNLLVASLAVLFNLLLLGLAGLAWSGGYVLIHLLWRDSQRAEYLADILAAEIAGTQSSISMLEKLNYDRVFAGTLQRVALGTEGKNLFAEFQQDIAVLPQRELERIRRVRRLLDNRADVTHPPTAYRVELLARHTKGPPRILIQAAESVQLERELAALRPRIQDRLVDIFKSRLYA